MNEKTDIQVPTSALRLSESSNDECKFQFTEGTDEESRPRFRMVANSGSIIQNHYFWQNFAIDLDGILLGRQKKAALRDHNPEQVVGYTDKIEITEEGLVAEGFFTETNDVGKETLALARAGFPFQASVMVPPSAIEKVPSGETAFVNGHELQGPGHIFRKSALREVTFTAIGADEATEAVMLSENGNTTVNAVVYQFSSIDEIGKEDLMQEDQIIKEPEEQILNEVNEKEDEESAEFAVKQERLRVTAILNAACSGQEQLAKNLVELGTSLEEAQTAMLSDIKERMGSRLSEIVDAAPASAGVEEEEAAQFSTIEEELAFKFNKTEELKNEFGDVDVYIAYQKAIDKGSIKEKGMQ